MWKQQIRFDHLQTSRSDLGTNQIWAQCEQDLTVTKDAAWTTINPTFTRIFILFTFVLLQRQTELHTRQFNTNIYSIFSQLQAFF